MLSLIVAYSKNRVIGKEGRLPWNIPGELKRFKNLTTNNVVIFGRVTYEEIGKPLENRMNIIISRTKNFDEKNCFTVKSLEDAIKFTKGKQIYIGGGEGIFKQAVEIVDKMYITVIDKEFEGDRYFPNFDESKFKIHLEKEVGGEIPYKYFTYTRI